MRLSVSVLSKKPASGTTVNDGVGFLLIGIIKTSPMTWNVPSNENPVEPMELPNSSSKFGDVNQRTRFL
jgi:hypothetical protein